jgi:KaiC/GvpD/RAD55 family RecA-like ATPase
MLDDSPVSVEEMESGQSLLVAGPPMTGKYQLLFELLGEAADRGIVITTGDPAEDVRAEFVDAANCSPSDVGVVDCVTKQQGGSVADDDLTRYVSSPKNVTEIGMKFTDQFERFREYDDQVGVGLHSLSELLVYLDAEDVYKFTRVLTKQAESEGWFTVATIGSTMHDEQTLHTMYEPFDTVIDTREQDGQRELRVRDGREPAAAWSQF